MLSIIPPVIKKYISYIVFIFIFAQQLLAQNNSNNAVTAKQNIFDIEQGYKIYSANSIFYDANNWLWISGKKIGTFDYQIGNREHIIQRFNGSSFEDIPMPETGMGANQDVYLYKRNDGLIYVTFSKNQDSKLFLLNPETLVYKALPIPENSDYKKHLITLTTFKDNVYVTDVFNNEAIIYRLDNNLNFNKITSIIYSNSFDKISIILFEEYFFVNDLSNGILVYSYDGTLLKEIKQKTIAPSSSNGNSPLIIQYWFQKNGHTYMKFSKNDYLYEFNSAKITWEISDTSKYYSSNTTTGFMDGTMFQDEHKNVVLQNKKKDSSYISIFKNNLSKPYFRNSIKGSEFVDFTSRNLQKELVISNQGKLYIQQIAAPTIKTFLNDYSIRGMLQTNKDEVLIATENKGWYLLDLLSFQVKKTNLTLNNTHYTSVTNRGFLKDKTGIWCSDDKGILFIDNQTFKTSPYYLYRVNTLTQDENYIYYGANTVNKLMKFDKKTKEHSPIFETETVQFQKIIKQQQTLYTATNRGLLVYKNDQGKFYTLAQEDNFLLTVIYSKTYGILVGTRSGKVYTFNETTKKFSLLYTDALHASIATILFDDAHNIWLNTFAGFVKFNPKTNTTTRFTMRDGLSHFEANRYSALKTTDGHFLVGTLRGLNYFHPDSLTAKTITASLQLSSLIYFKEGDKTATRVLSPEKLSQPNKIVLPVNKKNLELNFGLTGIFKNEDIEYRYRFNKEQWISLRHRTNVNLLSIPSGKQVVEIEALDFSKNKIGKSILIPLFVKDYFYNKWWFYAIVLGIVLLILFLILSRRRKKELNIQLEKENNAIKKDLQNYTHQLIERNKEKKLLSEEFEKLKANFGEQEDLEKLQELSTSKILTNEDWAQFKEKFTTAYPQYLIALKNKGYKFTPAEERLITLEKLGLNTEEISNMLGVSSETIRKTRYRLRKKLAAPNTISIIEHLETL